MTAGDASEILAMEQDTLVAAGMKPLPALGELVSALTYLPGDVAADAVEGTDVQVPLDEAEAWAAAQDGAESEVEGAVVEVVDETGEGETAT